VGAAFAAAQEERAIDANNVPLPHRAQEGFKVCVGGTVKKLCLDLRPASLAVHDEVSKIGLVHHYWIIYATLLDKSRRLVYKENAGRCRGLF
jgi:hypothetical protein